MRRSPDRSSTTPARGVSWASMARLPVSAEPGGAGAGQRWWPRGRGRRGRRPAGPGPADAEEPGAEDKSGHDDGQDHRCRQHHGRPRPAHRPSPAAPHEGQPPCRRPSPHDASPGWWLPSIVHRAAGDQRAKGCHPSHIHATTRTTRPAGTAVIRCTRTRRPGEPAAGEGRRRHTDHGQGAQKRPYRQGPLSGRSFRPDTSPGPSTPRKQGLAPAGGVGHIQRELRVGWSAAGVGGEAEQLPPDGHRGQASPHQDPGGRADRPGRSAARMGHGGSGSSRPRPPRRQREGHHGPSAPTVNGRVNEARRRRPAPPPPRRGPATVVGGP